MDPKTLATIVTIIAITAVTPTVHLFNLIALPVTGSLDTGRIVIKVLISLLLLFDGGTNGPIRKIENKKNKIIRELVLSCFSFVKTGTTLFKVCNACTLKLRIQNPNTL